jgi:hypothetical protein
VGRSCVIAGKGEASHRHPGISRSEISGISFFKLTGYQLAKSSLADIAEGLGSPKAAILEPDLSYLNKAIQQ